MAKDYLPRVTILWLILTSAELPTGKPTTVVLKDIGSAEKKLQYVAKTDKNFGLCWDIISVIQNIWMSGSKTKLINLQTSIAISLKRPPALSSKVLLSGRVRIDC